MQFYKDYLTKEATMVLAHEVKNPVSLIKANIELLEFERVLDNHKSNLRVIKNELNKISELISDFMLYCNTSCDIKEDGVDIFQIVKEHTEKFSVYNNITFSINCFENIEDIFIMADESKIAIVLSNVYKNCIESIEDKQGFIQTNIYIKDKNIVIDIIDNGKGIDEEIYSKIYEPFFTMKKDGSGLGIPICVKILESLDGSFTIFNNKEDGCTTRVIIPKAL